MFHFFILEDIENVALDGLRDFWILQVPINKTKTYQIFLVKSRKTR